MVAVIVGGKEDWSVVEVGGYGREAVVVVMVVVVDELHSFATADVAADDLKGVTRFLDPVLEDILGSWGRGEDLYLSTIKYLPRERNEWWRVVRRPVTVSVTVASQTAFIKPYVRLFAHQIMALEVSLGVVTVYPVNPTA
ncbi:hypothetical protein E2C01_024148 [Portunus trituberculatus]|uniref:Uncharacterized protein n=1 Tax=Portunus trituberculatus TaxID=210409 RepID=A0A5B7ECD9_PORTR|nr:hypothetical protein [Portunus trituberculatus]